MTIIKYPEKCPNCKREIKHRNKIIEIEGVKYCLICREEKIYEEIMAYLEGRSSPIFVCSNIGEKNAQCDLIIPSRDYLKFYSTAELLQEALARLEKVDKY